MEGDDHPPLRRAALAGGLSAALLKLLEPAVNGLFVQQGAPIRLWGVFDIPPDKALLFIPSKVPNLYYTQDFKPGLQLYSAGVMIMDHCQELLPESQTIGLVCPKF